MKQQKEHERKRITVRQKLELLKEIERRNEKRREEFKRKNGGKIDAKRED